MELPPELASRPSRKAGQEPSATLTLDAYNRLKAELDDLRTNGRSYIAERLKVAREHGDLRENAEYKSAKERQSFLQARVAQLHRRLAALNMVNLDRIPRDKVGLGSVVTVRQEDTSEESVYEIVVPEDADPTIGRISPSSPIGKCLLGHEEGDSVEVRVPSGTRVYEVTKLVTIHEQMKDEQIKDESSPA